MPEKPQNNNSKKRSEDSSSDPSRSDPSDGIDNLELEPISSQLPVKKSADSIPSKPALSEDSELTDDQIDDISLESIDIEDSAAGSLEADAKDKPEDKQKSTKRMYPSGKEVDLTAKTPKKSTTPKPKSIKKEPPIPAAEADEPTIDENTVELIIDDEPLPNQDSEEVNPLVEEPQTKDKQPNTVEQEAVPESPSRDEDVDTDDDLIQEDDEIEDDAPRTKRSENLSVKKKTSMSVIEKGALSLFLLLIIVGLAIYVPQMIPEGQLTNNIVDVADTPIKLEGITVESLEARWTETINIASRVRRNVKWTPEVELAISGSDSGALRFIFLDQNGRQRGDTIDIAFANGKFEPSMQSSAKIYCTHGFTSELDLKDLQARGDAFWTVRVLKGQNLKAPSSEFENVIEMKIPFEIVVSK